MGNELCCASLWSTEGHSHPRIVQQHDLFGVPEALSEFGELHQKLDEAYNKNHDAAMAALFTDGMFSGRQDIEKRYPPLLHPINWSVRTL
jgi:hypothetical protein